MHPGLVQSVFITALLSCNSVFANTDFFGLEKILQQTLYNLPGKVTDPNGHPLAGVELIIMPFQSSKTVSDMNGQFILDMNPKRLQRLDEKFLLVGRHRLLGLVGTKTIDGDTKYIDMVLQKGVTVEGQVTDSNETPLPNATVNLYMHLEGTRTPIENPECNDLGQFKVYGLMLKQPYELEIIAKGYGSKIEGFNSNDAFEGVITLGTMSLMRANLSLQGIVVDVNDQPLVAALVHVRGAQQSGTRFTKTGKDGRFQFEDLCPGIVQISAFLPSGGKMRSMQVEAGVTDLKVMIGVTESQHIPHQVVRRQPASLKGKKLPDLEKLNLKQTEDLKGKSLLLCFWDMQQRPARRCLLKLKEQTKILSDRGIVVVAIQTTDINQDDLLDWLKKYDISFPCGNIIGGGEETRFKWGIHSVPWLVLTDKEHVVFAEGFKVSELEGTLGGIQHN